MKFQSAFFYFTILLAIIKSGYSVRKFGKQAYLENDEIYKIKFTINLGKRKDYFIMEVRYAWAPLGAARLKKLVTSGFFDGCRFFRVIKDFMVQFGMSGDPAIQAQWKDKKIMDDEVIMVNTRGYVSFASSGKNTRTTQLFINTVDNINLDNMGFSPVGQIVEGMEVVDEIYAGYGEGGQGDGRDGKGPSQARIEAEGNKYLKKYFPKLSYIVKAEIIEEGKKDPREL